MSQSSAASILVVDDDVNASAMLSLVLAAGKFEEIAVVPNAEEAFELLELEGDDDTPPRFDVIMLDVMMPGMDGIEACARIRATRRYRDVPILMCTGVTETESLNQAFIAGANDYLSKPYSKIELLARVRSAMRLKRELDRRRARETELRKVQNRDLAEEKFFDRITGLPTQEAFNAQVRRSAERDAAYGMLALQVVQAVKLREEAGTEAFQGMMHKVASALATVPAPLPWRLFSFNDGLFMILAPGASGESLARVGDLARTAVNGLQLPHGHSAEHDFVRLVAASDLGRGSELLTLPAELIRALDRIAARPSDNGTGTLAA